MVAKPVPARTRKPTPEENKAAAYLSNRLLEATMPGEDEVEEDFTRPPGRINMREAKNLIYQQQHRMEITARPFHRVEVLPTDAIPSVCGIMCDCSGSMGNAQEMLGAVRYIVTESMTHIQGKVASVLFGYDAYGIQPVGKRVKEVEIYHAGDGYEDYVTGFSMLDGALNLIDGEGARVLVIITDGHFNLGAAVQYAEETMDMCRQAGVAVLWIDVSGYFARDDGYGYGRVIRASDMTPQQVAEAVGDAIIDQFKQAGHTRR